MAVKKGKKKEGFSEHYLQTTAKLCVYPVDIYEKVILVPDSERDTWRDFDTMGGGAHLVGTCGFNVQLVIGDVIKKELYDPACTSQVAAKVEEAFRYQVGQQFRMIEGFRQIELTSVSHKKLGYKYCGNVLKKDGTMSPDDLDRAIRNRKAYQVIKPL